MTLSLPSRRRPRSPGKAPLLFVGAAILAELLIAGSVVSDRLAPLMVLLVGVIAFVAVVRWPLLGMGLVIVLTATFLPSDYLQAQVGPLAVGYHEVALVGVLAAAVAFPRAKTWGGVAGGFLAIFMAVLALATILAISSGHLRFSDAVAWGRMFALLLVFYAVVRLFPDRESLGQLMRVAVGAAAVSGFVALIIAFGVDLSPVLGEAATLLREHRPRARRHPADPAPGHRPRVSAVLVRGAAHPAQPRRRPARLDARRPGDDREPRAQPQPQHVGRPAPRARGAHVHRRRPRPPPGRDRRARARRCHRAHRHRGDPGGPRSRSRGSPSAARRSSPPRRRRRRTRCRTAARRPSRPGGPSRSTR